MRSLQHIAGKKLYMIAPTPFFSDRGCHVQILHTYKLLERENSLTLFAYGLGREMPGINTYRVANFPWYSKIDPGPSFTKIIYDIFLYISMFYCSIKSRPDYYYCHLHEGAVIGLLLRVFFRVPVIFDMQGLLLSELQQAQWISPKARAFSHVVTRIERLLITQSDVVFVSSSNLQAEIKKRYTVQSTIVKIPHGPLYFQKKSTVWLTLPTNKIICGYIGGLQTGKGMEEFLYYMKKLPSEYHFVIMGYPHDKIESTIRLYGLENMVTLTGRVLYENTLNYVEQCDYLFSPKRQVFGQANSKLFTYKQTGKRVLCYDYPEYRTILGTQGIYVDPKKNNWVDVIRSLK